MLRRLFWSLILVLVTSVAAQARTEDVRCVQAQLNEAGHDAGAEDGIAGPRTRRALAAFVAAQDLPEGRPLDARSAVNWCRVIGMAVPALAAHWPSRRQELEIVISDSVNPVLASMIRSEAVNARRSVATRLGLTLAGTDRLVAGTSVAELRRLIARHSDVSIGNLDGALREHCNREDGFGAFAAVGIMVLCFDPEARPAIDITRHDMLFVLAHEATHLLQFQIGGVVSSRSSSERQIAIEGPIWLTEGLADLLGYQVALAFGPTTLRAQVLRRYEGRDLPDLSTLASRRALESQRSDVYRAGMIATTLLVEDHGLPALGDLIEQMGNGIAFETAFEARFGLTPAAFAEGFARRLRPPKPDRPPAAANAAPPRRPQEGVARTPVLPTGIRPTPPPLPPAPQVDVPPAFRDARLEAGRCVEEQLTAAGHAVGAVDGRLGLQSRRALAAYRQAAGLETGLPLTAANAPAWCRRIGLHERALRAHWPSRGTPLEVVQTSGVDASVAAWIASRAPQILRRLTARLELELATTDTLILGASALELRPILAARLGRPVDGALAQFLSERCRNASPPEVHLQPGLAVICLSPGLRTTSQGAWDLIDQALIQACLRLALWQVTGAAPTTATDAERVAAEGAAWLTEGYGLVSAEIIGYHRVGARYRARLLRRFAGRSLPDLRSFETDWQRGIAAYGDMREGGAIAVSLLVQEHGDASVGRMLALMGEGRGFEAAFTQSFGQSPTEFYDGFAARLAADAG